MNDLKKDLSDIKKETPVTTPAQPPKAKGKTNKDKMGDQGTAIAVKIQEGTKKATGAALALGSQQGSYLSQLTDQATDLSFIASQAASAEARAHNLGLFTQQQLMTIDAAVTEDAIAGIIDQAQSVAMEGKQTPYLLGHC